MKTIIVGDERKITIINTYSLRNRGDEMLLRGTIKLFEKLLENVQFYVFSSDPRRDINIYTKENLHYITQIPVPAFGMLKIIKSIGLSFWVLIVCMIYKTFKTDCILRVLPKAIERTLITISTSDCIIARSIDQLTDIFGVVVFFKNIYEIVVAKLLNKKVVLHAQSMYISRSGLIGNFLKLCLIMGIKGTKISVRDLHSYEFLKEIGIRALFIPPPSILLSNQVGKSFMNKEENAGNNIAIVPRKELHGEKSLALVYSCFIEWIKDKYPNLRIVLLSQSSEKEYIDDDTTVINTICGLLSSKCNVSIAHPANLTEFLNIIAESKVVISERAISLLTALSLNVPAIGIDPYRGKNKGLMTLYGMEKFCIDRNSIHVNLLKEKFSEVYMRINELRLSLNAINSSLHETCIENSKTLCSFEALSG